MIAKGSCKFLETCKYDHDMEGFLATKPADIGDKCFSYDKYGICRFGLGCRFGASHIKGTEVIVKPDAKELNSDIDNFPDKRVITRVRKLKQKNFKAAKMIQKIEGTPMPLASGWFANLGIEPRNKKEVDFKNKLILAPLTTVGNLPFRVICKQWGADITVSEMAVASEILKGKMSEWTLLKRHKSEDVFGVQLCGNRVGVMTRCVEVLNENTSMDFIDINAGCPIDLVFNKGQGCGLLQRVSRLEKVVRSMAAVSTVPITLKTRTGIYAKKRDVITKLFPKVADWGISAVCLHGRTRFQRYSGLADWNYINECTRVTELPFIGNGDIWSWEEAVEKLDGGVASLMLARGAIIKPWLFTEIKERRHIDMSSSQRFELIKEYTNQGLYYWGSDSHGVERTRYFLLNWLSFLCRYPPVALYERFPKMNEAPPSDIVYRDDLETLMASHSIEDWIKLSEMTLGPVPEGFSFQAKHKAKSYDAKIKNESVATEWG